MNLDEMYPKPKRLLGVGDYIRPVERNAPSEGLYVPCWIVELRHLTVALIRLDDGTLVGGPISPLATGELSARELRELCGTDLAIWESMTLQEVSGWFMARSVSSQGETMDARGNTHSHTISGKAIPANEMDAHGNTYSHTNSCGKAVSAAS